VQRLARAKAEALAGAGVGVEELVLGCDSVLVFDNEVFGKPVDAAEASRRWRRMAGQWAELHTGHCLRPRAGRIGTTAADHSDHPGFNSRPQRRRN